MTVFYAQAAWHALGPLLRRPSGHAPAASGGLLAASPAARVPVLALVFPADASAEAGLEGLVRGSRTRGCCSACITLMPGTLYTHKVRSI